MKDDCVRLLHIRDSIDRILDYTESGREAFLAGPKTQDAVLRNLEIIGEAVKSLTSQIKNSSPGPPWRQIAGMRDKLIHDYFGVDVSIVWDVVDTQLGTLRATIIEMIRQQGCE